MKTTTITIAALLVAFGSFAQQNVEQKKSEEIKKDPLLYESQGGVLDDKLIDTPDKTKKPDYVDPNGHFIIYGKVQSDEVKKKEEAPEIYKDPDGDFIIHRKSETLEVGETQFDRDLKKLKAIKDQKSYDYMNEKELFLLKYPEMRPAEWDGKVEPRTSEPTNLNQK